ncbi:MAG: nickel pincer cofactor biosynthesis protein LarC [Lachnospiraceae bacterium]|nr:nickel pincer cofactor biosynthesis protein LarC [Lachnospiraceae bacterium]
MKTLYIECNMGAAGDMLTAALLEILPENERDGFVEELNGIGIPGVRFEAEKCVKCGITGTHMKVTVDGAEEESEDVHEPNHSHEHNDHDHEHEHDDHDHGHAHSHGGHHHSGMDDIKSIIGSLKIPTTVKFNANAVYSHIAEAESHAHNCPVSDIHFHEVGTMDAIADVVAVCMLMKKIDAGKVVVSPIHVGSGQVRCAHGILPVPAPATAYILKDVPIYGGSIKGELCTPTGAALLKYFADSFGEMPAMKVISVGYGMGKKDFEAANCVRAILGESVDTYKPVETGNTRAFDGKAGRKDELESDLTNGYKEGSKSPVVVELNFNVDDMTGERLSFAMERLFDAGAFEVFTVPVGMKKSRQGTLVKILCDEEHKEKIIETVFKHTTTIGIREVLCSRYILDRKITTVETKYGPVRKKEVSGYGANRYKYEYDDLAKIAKEKNISIEDVIREVEREDRQG